MQSWTNNNCESINAQLKQYVDWRPQQLPALLDTIIEMITAQHREADKAMVGCGEYKLIPSAAKHRITMDTWISMSAEQQKRTSNSCFKLPTVAVTSTDSKLTVPLTPGAGKKLNQVKRRRNAKTT
jgi:hypothetical protein